MSNIYLISDTHFGHNKPFIYADRGYKDVSEMNKDLIEKWNATVNPEDVVYHLGDVMLGSVLDGMDCLNQLNGHIHIILGNHDSDARRVLYASANNVEDITYADMVKAGKWKFFLSHYPTMVGNFDDPKKLWNISGHIHTTDKFLLKEHLIYNVTVDAHSGFPIALDEIKEDIRGLVYGN